MSPSVGLDLFPADLKNTRRTGPSLKGPDTAVSSLIFLSALIDPHSIVFNVSRWLHQLDWAYFQPDWKNTRRTGPILKGPDTAVSSLIFLSALISTHPILFNVSR